jgi:glycerol-3-phosphate acyltransferase PlsY
MSLFLAILLFFSAYLLGSIPTAVWIGKIFYKLDVRDHGSKNAGFTNAMRILGLKAGIPVLLLDIAKGFFAVFLFKLFPEDLITEFTQQSFPIILGLLALLGHIFPILAQFRGGKGVATGAGLLLGLFPLGAGLALAVFLILLFTFKYVSLGSLIASLSFPVWVLIFYPVQNISLLVFSFLLTSVIIFTHRKNIGRLIKGKENKIYFRKK